MFLRRARSDTPRLTRSDRDGRTPVAPSVALVGQLLDEFGLTHALDDDGDVIVRWEKCSIYVFFYGEQHEVVQTRLYLNRRFSVDDRGALALLVDEWNRTRLFGKAYTILPDDGMVAICAETTHDFEGASRAQLKHTLATWIDSLLRFADWVDEQL